MLTRIFAFALCAALASGQTPIYQPGHRTPKILAGYFIEWGIYGANYDVKNVETSGSASRLTHILYAFANVTSTGQCQIADSWADYQKPFDASISVDGVADSGAPNVLAGNFNQLIKLKKLHPNLKVMISLGGASDVNSAGFAASASTPRLRSALVSSCIDMFIRGNLPGVSAAGLFDGLDIDWEFPGAADKTNYTLLLAEFRSQLTAETAITGKPYLLTIAAPAGQQNFSNMELSKIHPYLDFLNLETYDYHGTWESTTNHETPLYPSFLDPDRSQNFNIDYTVGQYIAAHIPPQKLVLGMAFYGRGWQGVPSVNHGLYQTSTGPAPGTLQGGVEDFKNLENLPGFTQYWDPYSKSQWIYSPTLNGGTFWTFDNPASVAIKMTYLQTRVPNGLGGAMFWELSGDDGQGTLINALAAGLGR